MREKLQEVERIFEEALELESAKRADFLGKACIGNEPLRKEVECLLEMQSEAEYFMEKPAIEVAARLLSDSRLSMVGKNISHYKILQELGNGGMGVVYKAEDTRLGRHVALKFLPEEMASDRQALKRFRREACAASTLNHPCICTIHDIDEFEGRTFIVMELLEGMTLRERIGLKPLLLDEVLAFGRQIASGLDAAHSKGIIHRDIKPDNIFITRLGQAKILDFGLAKLTKKETESKYEAETAPPGAGTLKYMSPEQALGKELDVRTDIWSFGVTLYEMATGISPFDGRTSAAVSEEILHADPVDPSKLNPELPRKLDRIIAGMLRKNVSDRTSSAAQVAAELTSVDRELICFLELSNPSMNRDLINILSTWAESHSMEIRYILLPGPKGKRIEALEDLYGEATEAINPTKDSEVVRELGISNANLISWDEICAWVDFKSCYARVLEAYRSNRSFADDCISQASSDLQPIFEKFGVENKWDERVWVNRWVRYLLEELALKIALFESGEFHGEILPKRERDIVRRIYSGVYFPCCVTNRGFEVISLSQSRISHSHYIPENEAGMFGFVLQHYFAQESK
jgi:serine/threonine protein kinase